MIRIWDDEAILWLLESSVSFSSRARRISPLSGAGAKKRGAGRSARPLRLASARTRPCPSSPGVVLSSSMRLWFIYWYSFYLVLRRPLSPSIVISRRRHVCGSSSCCMLVHGAGLIFASQSSARPLRLSFAFHGAGTCAAAAPTLSLSLSPALALSRSLSLPLSLSLASIGAGTCAAAAPTAGCSTLSQTWSRAM